MSAYHAYGRMFKDRVEPIIQQEWIDKVSAEQVTEEEKAKPIPKAPLPFRNEVVKRLLVMEPQEIQDQVDKWHQDEHAKATNVEDEDNEEAQRVNTAKWYHKC